MSEDLKSALFYERKNVGLKVDEVYLKNVQAYCEEYKVFLDRSKTERKACESALKLAQQNGFEPFEWTRPYNPGEKFYFVNRNKSIILGIAGKQSLLNGIKLAVAHIDSPRLDLKPNPLFEDSELAFLKTHYYGGLKKYQWTAIPLSLYGVVFTKNGEKVEVEIGEKEGDPVFCVSDLLPHLAQNQMKAPLKDAISGESLNIVVGSIPLKCNEKTELIKLNILKILNEKFGITERDFLSAEFEAVPNFKASDIGFDRGLVGAYGQDDRVCAYNALQAILGCSNPEKTTIVVLADREEIGSYGNTGMNSNFFEYFMFHMGQMHGVPGQAILTHSQCLSVDVGAAFDPAYSDVFEKRNCALCGCGTIISKYSGSRGKSGTSDAHAEYVDLITRNLDGNGIIWQAGELGKVDLGGGGTVAMFLSRLNMDVVDIGVPILSMHSPYEVASKFDIYENFRAIGAFFKD